ncbi:MAG: UDP-4-amino-4,6-dideoxy-N-acetyl-beta-L-altrosamine transaminase [Candidatus Margulisiibacteriota bacterium]|nr:UDP-4-amino-4,6-dideoxy-N-acetyl-beta-L-altrosamine transaminase [Candidatus Margulisiibacteriota bacterium]
MNDRIPYATQWIEDDDIKAVVDVLKSDMLTQGPKTAEFEEKVAQYSGAKYGVAVNSGTSALHIATLAAGISEGDEVITSPITFTASSNSVLYCGGKPVFADVEEDTINIDPKEIKAKVNAKTKAIIPVHFAGNPCRMEEISSIAKENNLTLIEDAAHAIGAEYKGIKIGSCQYSDMTILSFHAVKHITTGEGGMVLTNDPELRDKLIFHRSHGITRNEKYMKTNPGAWYYEMHELGYNYRLTDIQSALGISQLKKLDKFVVRRKEIAEIYNQAFSGSDKVRCLAETKDGKSSWHLYVIEIDERKRIFEALREKNIIVNVHYIPVYKQPYYQRSGYKDVVCPNAEAYYKRAMSIPMYPKMSDEEQKYVIELIKELVNE